MQLDELRRVREAERDTDSLQHLDDDFYLEVGDYLDELRERRDGLAAESSDPFADTEVRQVADELKTATRIVESLYERRVGKIVKLGSFAAADMRAETEGLTSEEQALFDAIVGNIRENREEVLDILEDDAEARTDLVASADDGMARGGTGGADSSTDPGAGEEERSDPETEEPDPPESSTDDPGTAEEPPDHSDTVDRTTVRITEDIGEIVGVDEHAYELVADDVVSLPTDNARPLIERGVADDLD